jgi:predicted Zn-dependent protease
MMSNALFSSSVDRHAHPSNRERLHALLDVLSYLYMVYGKPERARDYLELLIKLRPSESRLRRVLARSELELGNPDRAQEILEQSLELEMTTKERAATFLMLSRTFLRLQRKEDSSAAAHQFLQEMHSGSLTFLG